MNREDIPSLDRRGLRNFGLMMAGFIAVLFGLGFPWLLGRPLPWWPWLVATAFLVWSLAAPITLNPVYRVWMRFGLVLNAIMSRVVLGLVYYLAVLPTGVIMRLAGKDPMRRRRDPGLDSYRVPSHKSARENMEKPF